MRNENLRLVSEWQAVFSALSLCRGPLVAVSLLLLVSVASGDTSNVIADYKTCIYSTALSPDGRTLVSAGTDRQLHFLPIRTNEFPPEESRRHRALIARLDDQRFQVRQDAFLELLEICDVVKPLLEEVAASSESREMRYRAERLLVAASVPRGFGHRSEVRSIAYSPDGQWLASASRDNSIRLWSGNSGRAKRVLFGHSEGAWSVAFSPDGKVFATGGGDHHIRLWDTENWQEKQCLRGHSSTTRCIAFHPHGERLATAGGFDKAVRIWNCATGQCLATLDSHQDAVMTVAFSADGKTLASAGYDGSVYLWNAHDFRPRGEFVAHQDVIRRVVFSPRKNRLVTAGDDNTVKIWNVFPEDDTVIRPLAVVREHASTIQDVHISKDGRFAVTATTSGKVRLWKFDDGDTGLLPVLAD